MQAWNRQRLQGFHRYGLQFYCWTLRHPTDLFAAKTLLRNCVCVLALEKGYSDVLVILVATFWTRPSVLGS